MESMETLTSLRLLSSRWDKKIVLKMNLEFLIGINIVIISEALEGLKSSEKKCKFSYEKVI